jgi:ribosomal protein L22
VTPANPQDPQKGKVSDDVGKTAEEAAAAKTEVAAEAAAEAEPQPEPRGRRRRRRAAPQAEGTAAAETGVDKDAADAAQVAATTAEEPQAAPADDAPAGDRPGRGGGAEAPTAAEEPAQPAPAPRPRRERPAAAPAGVAVRAQARYVRTSARKARLVCDNIRGKDVAEARAILAYTPRAAAKPWSKLLESAVANAEHNHELVGDELRIESIHADEGPTLKRFRPRAMGRATRIRKRTSHLTITLTPKES